MVKKYVLSNHELSMLEYEVEKNKKSIPASWFLFLILGCFGAHKFYLHQKQLGFIYMGISFCFIFATLITEGYSDTLIRILDVLCWLWTIGYFLYDVITLSKQIKNTNNDIEEQALQKILSLRA